MIFYIVVDGKGECCDYGIGRNKDFKRLAATTWQQAQEEAWTYLKDRGYEELDILSANEIRGRVAEHRVAELRILEVALDEKFDLDKWLKPYLEHAREKDAAKDRAEKEAQFEALKKELGK